MIILNLNSHISKILTSEFFLNFIYSFIIMAAHNNPSNFMIFFGVCMFLIYKRSLVSNNYTVAHVIIFP